MDKDAQCVRVSNTQCTIGENPLWHANERALYWCDIPCGRLLRLDPLNGETVVVRDGPGALGGFTIETDGSFLLFLDRGRIAHWRDGKETVLLDGIERERDSRYNDVIADGEGRVFCGTMRTPDQLGALYRLDQTLRPSIVWPDVGCSNGLAFSLDSSMLYYVDSHARTVSVFDFDLAEGLMSNCRNLRQFLPTQGTPDGMTIDAEDHLWIAFWGASYIGRFNRLGDEIARFTVPTANVTSLTFGGDDLSTLYITTARNGEDEDAGKLYALRPGVRGRTDFRSRVVVGFRKSTRWVAS